VVAVWRGGDAIDRSSLPLDPSAEVGDADVSGRTRAAASSSAVSAPWSRAAARTGRGGSCSTIRWWGR